MNFNMFAGAFLAVVFVVMSLNMASDAIYHAETPEPDEQGFAIVVADGGAVSSEPEEEEELGLISPLLASADPGNGEGLFRRCSACHLIESGGANRVGPNLWNIVDKPAGAEADFGYSTAMVDYAAGGALWDFEALNRFLYDPGEYIDGTSMGFAGIERESERADLIAYLRTAADSPVDLPDPNAAPAEEAEAEAEDGDDGMADDEAEDGEASEEAEDGAATE